MQLDNSQLGDATIGDVATNVVRVALHIESQSAMMAELLRRVSRLERAGVLGAHIARLNALVTLALLLSALYRYSAGNRRVGGRR
jgi:hypothetical protein